MALIFIDGFDHYDPQAVDANGDRLLSRGKASALSALARRITGRRPASFALRLPGEDGQSSGPRPSGYFKQLPAPSGTLTLGAALRWEAVGGHGSPPVLLGIIDAHSERAYQRRPWSDGRLALQSWGRWMWEQTVAETVQLYAAGAWHYIELQVVQGTPDLADGSLTLRVNGTQVLHLSDQRTREASDGGLMGIYVGARNGEIAPARVDVDDLYVTDASGTVNQGFLGDVRIDTLQPQASGSLQQWAVQPSGTADWQALGDGLDHTLLSAADPGLRHSVRMQALPALRSPVIHGVQLSLLARKSDAGQASLRSLVISGAQTALGPNTALADSLLWSSTVIEQDPGAAAPWTPGTLADAEFGAESA